MIIGISEGGASKQGLELALEMADRVDIFHDPSGRTFHPKVYMLRSTSSNCLFVGSNNMTAGGLFRNYEAGIIISDGPESIYDEVDQWITKLRADPHCCIRLDDEKFAILVSDKRYRIGDEDEERAVARTPAAASDPSSLLFRVSDSDKKTARRHPGIRKAEIKAGSREVAVGWASSDGSADGATLLEWSKKLLRSDAQQLGNAQNTNLTGALRLTQSRHPIDKTTYFRDEFFGREIWYTDSKDTDVQYTEITADVSILGEKLGSMSFRVDHSLRRESGQANFTTVLKWGPLNATLRENSYVDDWVLLQQLEVGYRLDIVATDPGTHQ